MLVRVLLQLKTVVVCIGDLVLGAGGARVDGLPAAVSPQHFAILWGGGVTDTAGPGGVVDNPPLHLGRGDSGESRGTAGGHCLYELHEALGLSCGRRAVALHLLHEHGGGIGGGVGCQLAPPDGF